MKRNIYITYILAFAKNTWFWLGIWIFYYLRFTDYAGIGLIETVLIVTITLTEIPTGAVADLLGKKNTLIIAFFLEAVGGIIMAMSLNLPMLMLAVFIMCVGGAFYSGTLEALLYDSLKQSGEETHFDKKISNVKTISLIAPAICGATGGFLYLVHPTIPFWANAIGYIVGLAASLFLIEPKIDTEKFSFRNFISQNKAGLRELVKTYQVKQYTILMISIGFFVVIASEMLDSFLGFEFGYSETQLGILWSAIFLISAFASQLTPIFYKTFGSWGSLIASGLIISITFILSPILGIITGGVVLTLRTSFEEIFGNLSSVVINQNTESRYRATTISTFNMIKNIPYILVAFLIGSVSDRLSAKSTALYLGTALLIFIVIQIIISAKYYVQQDHKLT